MQKFIIGLVLSSRTHKIVLFVFMLGTLFMVELITYRETTNWLSDEFTKIIQEDNVSFQ